MTGAFDQQLPTGHRVLARETVASTNADALALASAGEPAGLWVTARAQASGRGRGGRQWSSPPGNLYASHLLLPACPLPVVQQLALLAPVALHDAVAALLGAPAPLPAPLRLKWPNDLLVNGAKVSGILLESTHTAGQGLAVVLGFGLNLASHPDGLDQPATHLCHHRSGLTPERALAALAHALAAWLEIWQEGAGFAAVRAAWMERAGPLGETLHIRVSSDLTVPRVTGRYTGLDADGALLLSHPDGTQCRYIQGDVALAAADR